MRKKIAGHLISGIQDGSIASELGVLPGDRLLLIDGQPVLDVFDYRLRQICSQMLVTIVSGHGEIFEFDIDKYEDEDLGLEFENPVMIDYSECKNNCVFCFIDQLPKGMRKSLYFKDDDLRLSFLTGNYVTLTNLTDSELGRLIDCRFSPINLSVHTTNSELRLKMLRHHEPGTIMERMRRITEAGLTLNVQIVVCPGLNDGAELTRTLDDLISLGPMVQSIAIVPVGLTCHRQENHLFPLRPLDQADAVAVLDEVGKRQLAMLAQRQTRLVYAADEIYLKAGHELPDAAEFEDFPQLENGVGMASLLRLELAAGLQSSEKQQQVPLWTGLPQAQSDSGSMTTAVMVTGTAAAPILQPWLPMLASRSGIELWLAPVANRFFGENITVAGLLTGQDIIAQLPAFLQQLPPTAHGQTCLILPECLLKANENILLDDCSIQQIADASAMPVYVCAADADGLIGLLDWLSINAAGAAPASRKAAKS